MYYVYLSQINVYRKPSFHSEVDTQAVCGDNLVPLKEQGDFIRVRCPDDYEGWVNSYQVSETEPPLADTRLLGSLRVPFYTKPDLDAPLVGGAGAGARVYVLEELTDWFKIFLPMADQAYIQTGHVARERDLTAVNLLETARQFMGVPYLWGGKTSNGLDCSGFVQLVHHLHGEQLRRDAWMQFEDATPVGDDFMSGRPGDLMFFAETGEKITHVGFCLGNGKVLHSRGFVRINSLRSGDPDFSRSLLDSFVAVGTYLTG